MRKRITYQISLSPKSSKKETKFLVEQYRVLSADRLSHDQLFWNVQIMGLTAQSFLLILALGGFGNASWVKAIGAFIGLIYSFLSIQGFERNRYMELSDAESMLSIERSFIDQGFRGVEVHDKPPKRKLLSGDSINQILCTDGVNNFFSRSIGYFLWKNGLWAILVTNAFLLIYNIIFYSFKNLVGKFFLYASFKVFWNSFSSFAIASILALIVLNWVLFLAEEIIMQQPKCISKYYYSGVVAPIQKELKHRNLG